MKRSLLVWVAIALVFGGSVVAFRFSGGAAAWLWSVSDGGTWLLPLVAVSALIDSINPCAFSILLLTIAFLFSVGKERRSILAIGGWYLFGIFIAYLFIGLGLLQALHLFGIPHAVGKVAALILAAWGIFALVQEFIPSFPVRFAIPHSAHRAMAVLMEKASFPAAFLLGALVGLCEFPCTGGPYLMVVGLLHDHATYLSGVLYLIFYNLIFVSPLVVMLALAGNTQVLETLKLWQRHYRRPMKIGGSIAMIGIAILILFFL